MAILEKSVNWREEPITIVVNDPVEIRMKELDGWSVREEKHAQPARKSKHAEKANQEK